MLVLKHDSPICPIMPLLHGSTWRSSNLSVKLFVAIDDLCSH